MQVPLKAGLAVLALVVPLVSPPTAKAFAGDRYRLVQLFNTSPGENRPLEELRKSAEQGDPNAQYMLGLAHDVGVGAGQDFAEAAAWYRKAADQGHAGAQFNLGHLYADGRGVTQDLVQAHMWLNLAAAGSQPGARNERELVAKKMTRSQVAEALRLARAWQPRTNASAPSGSSPPSEPPSSGTDDRNRPR
jgi:TPR repeat protein